MLGTDLASGLIILVFSVIFHELMHGVVALLLGDPTAKQQGRLTLNPIPHIDVFGTLLLPMILLVTGSPVIFGSAKPVPINPRYFDDPRKDMALVGLAGPAANFLLAGLSAVLFHLTVGTGIDGTILSALLAGVRINLLLGVFNLIPIPPLDGSRLLAGILPGEFAVILYRLEPYGLFILLFLLFFPVGPVSLGHLVFSAIQALSRLMGVGS